MATAVSIVAYLALFFVVGFSFLFINLLVGRFLRPDLPNPEKLAIYECGEPTIGSSFVQFDLRFYVVALLFLIFDVEVAFFFPWAAVYGTTTHLMDPNLVKVVENQPPVLTPAVETLYATLGAQLPETAGRTAGELRVEIEKTATLLAQASVMDIAVFFGVLLVGFAYVWRRGDIDWVRAVQATHREQIHRKPPTLPVEEPTPALAVHN